MIPDLDRHEEDLRLEARRLAADVLAPAAAGWEERAEFPAGAFRELCGRGLGAAVLPREHGGAGLSNVAAVAVFEELACGDLATAFALLVQNSCTRSLWLHGTDEQKERWLAPLTAGEAVGAYAITEPGAGSDAAALETTAAEGDGGWVLDGRKMLLSNGPVADVAVLAAKTEPDAGARGVSAFLVPTDAPGVTRGSRQETFGARALPIGELELATCRLPADALLGERGQGFKIALDAVTFARIAWGGLAAGLARAALDEALAFLRAREQFGGPLADQQSIRFELADMATEIEAARLLALRAAALVDRGEPYVVAAAMTKRFAGDMAVGVTSRALELLGGRSWLVPSPLERYARAARMAQLADGTANIQRLVIARSLV